MNYLQSACWATTPLARSAACHPNRPEAGIRTVMITGDYPITAQAIAQQIGLTEETSDWRLGITSQSLLSGPQIEAMDDDDLAAREGFRNVFARVSPEHKVRIVSAFKRNGHVVAITQAMA